MDGALLVVALVVMVVGLIGAVVPVMPGLLLVWATAVGSLLWQGTDTAGWVLAGVMTALFAAGTLAKVYLPTRSGRQGGVPAATAVATMAGAFAGFFLVPVVGLLLGAAVGLYLGERWRLGEHGRAMASVWRILRAFGVGVLVELGIGVTMIAIWVVAVLVRA